MLDPKHVASRSPSQRYKFDNFLKEIFLDSDTKIALLSGAPFDDPSWWLLTNEQIARRARRGQLRRGIAAHVRHSVFTPGQRLDGRGRARRSPSSSPMPGRATRSAIRSRCGRNAPLAPRRREARLSVLRACRQVRHPQHLHPQGAAAGRLRKSLPDVWQYATVDDVPKAAKDWPELNFIIYHSALRPFLYPPDAELAHSTRPATSAGRPTSRSSPPEARREERLRARSAPRSPARRWRIPRFGAAFVGQLVKMHGRRSRALGHGLGLVRVAAMADRSAAPPRDPRRHDEEDEVEDEARRPRQQARQASAFGHHLGDVLRQAVRRRGCVPAPRGRAPGGRRRTSSSGRTRARCARRSAG